MPREGTRKGASNCRPCRNREGNRTSYLATPKLSAEPAITRLQASPDQPGRLADLLHFFPDAP